MYEMLTIWILLGSPEAGYGSDEEQRRTAEALLHLAGLPPAPEEFTEVCVIYYIYFWDLCMYIYYRYLFKKYIYFRLHIDLGCWGRLQREPHRQVL